MKIRLNNLLKILTVIGLPRLFHFAFAPSTITILAYHGVTRFPLDVYEYCFIDEATFSQQLVYAKKYFQIVKLSQAVEMIHNNTIKRPTLVVTFDDGFHNNYELAFPILSSLSIPATIFPATKYIDTDDTLWFCHLHKAISETRNKSVEFQNKTVDLRDNRQKAIVSIDMQNYLKSLSLKDFYSEYHGILEQLGKNIGNGIERQTPYAMLTTDQIQEMSRSGLVEFGSHGHSHIIMNMLTAQQQESEIEQSKKIVEDITDHPCTLFSYPNGELNDFNNDSISILQRHGFLASTTMMPGPNTRNTGLMFLNRYGMPPQMNFGQYSVVIHHFDWALKRIVQRTYSRYNKPVY